MASEGGCSEMLSSWRRTVQAMEASLLTAQQLRFKRRPRAALPVLLTQVCLLTAIKLTMGSPPLFTCSLTALPVSTTAVSTGLSPQTVPQWQGVNAMSHFLASSS